MKRRETCSTCHQSLPFAKWSPPDDAGARYVAGEALAALSAEYEVSLPTLRARLVALGVAIRRRGLPKGHPPYNFTPPRRLAKMQKLRASGLTLKAIGEQFGVSRQAVEQVLSHYSKNGATLKK